MDTTMRFSIRPGTGHRKLRFDKVSNGIFSK